MPGKWSLGQNVPSWSGEREKGRKNERKKEIETENEKEWGKKEHEVDKQKEQE